MNLGQTVKILRKNKSIKQTELAKRCSITPSYLCNIEGNKKEPTLSVLYKISSALGIPIAIIFFLAMDIDDVSESKSYFFETLDPLIKNTLLEAFTK